MNVESFAPMAVLLLAVTTLILLTSPDWRLSIVALAFQYVGVFVLVAVSWTLALSVTKLVTGWIAGAVLGMSISGLPLGAQMGSRLSGRLVRFFSAALVALAVYSVAPAATEWISSLTVEQAWGGFLLIGMGLLQLGFAPAPLQTILGLLTAAAGFEIFYAAVETSALVAGLLSMTNLGLALVGAYLLVAPHMEKEE